jgi:hypothetical protein
LSENKIARKPSIIYRQKVGLRKSAGDTSLNFSLNHYENKYIPLFYIAFSFWLFIKIQSIIKFQIKSKWIRWLIFDKFLNLVLWSCEQNYFFLFDILTVPFFAIFCFMGKKTQNHLFCRCPLNFVWHLSKQFFFESDLFIYFFIKVIILCYYKYYT